MAPGSARAAARSAAARPAPVGCVAQPVIESAQSAAGMTAAGTMARNHSGSVRMQSSSPITGPVERVEERVASILLRLAGRRIAGGRSLAAQQRDGDLAKLPAPVEGVFPRRYPDPVAVRDARAPLDQREGRARGD